MEAPDRALPFVITEIGSSSPITVRLEDHDAPMGGPRRHEAFALGGENERHLIRLDGRPTPIVHTRFTVWEPVVIKGHFRDHFTGIDGRGRELVNSLQQLLDNQRLCSLKCGKWGWTAFPKKFRLPVEGEGDFTYELHFDVLDRPGLTAPPPREPKLPVNVYDLTENVMEELEADRVALLRQRILVTVAQALTLAYDGARQALLDARDAAQAFENAPPRSPLEPVLLTARATKAAVAAGAVLALLLPATPAAMLTSTDVADTARASATIFAAIASLERCKSAMRSLKVAANRRLRESTRLYRVAPGDTLDSIAQRELGSAARVGELALRPQDLVPGRAIRIPV